MKLFAFKAAVKGNYLIKENGFTFRLRADKVGFFVLSTPIQKEITYSKGATIRYIKHSVVGLGYMDSEANFSGLALFDMAIRTLVFLLIAVGVGYASYDILTGVFWAFLFYLLISFLLSSDDDSLLCKAKYFLKQGNVTNSQ